VNNLQIGGRNLLQNSSIFKVGIASYGISSSITPEGYLQVISSSSNGNYFTNWWNLDPNFALVESELKEGDDFTISFEVKSPDSASKPDIYIKSGMGYFGMYGTMSTEFSKIWYTGKWKDANYINPHLGFSNRAGTFIFKNWKIEKGNKATDWTPAPEDQVSDWSVTDVNSFAFIKNKPTQLSQFIDNIGVATHIADNTKHITSTERTNWNTAYG
jgi:hypothetical protein